MVFSGDRAESILVACAFRAKGFSRAVAYPMQTPTEEAGEFLRNGSERHGMHRLLDRLVIFGELDGRGILRQLADVSRQLEEGSVAPASLLPVVNMQVKHLLDMATRYAFDGNLWQSYLTFVLLTNENSFSLTAERRGIQQGSVTGIALSDFQVFRELFAFDFSDMEKKLGTTLLSLMCNYQAVAKDRMSYYRCVSDIVRSVRDRLAATEDSRAFYRVMCDAYKTHGVGAFGLNRAFRIRKDEGRIRHGEEEAGSLVPMERGGFEFVAINNLDDVRLSDLVGFESQKEQLLANTKAFLEGKPANNVLLYGDAGTGKSTSVKALLNEFYVSGLRIIELHKHQFEDLSNVVSLVKGRNYRFIIFIDDLSFEENEVEYKYLKAVIEGGLESRPENVLIYATSNRRHLIREKWSDRDDMEHDGDIHRSDTVQEKTSLAARFGVAINFRKPSAALYREIVLELAKRQLDRIHDEEELLRQADAWAIRHGGVSGRVAQQFIDSLAGSC